MDIMGPVSKFVVRKPGGAIALIVAITLVMILIPFVKPPVTEFDDSAFAPDHEAITSLNDIDEKFASENASRSIPILLYAQKPSGDPNILTINSMLDILELEKALADDPKIRDELAVPEFPEASFGSLPHLLAFVMFSDAATNPPTFGNLSSAFSSMTEEDLQDRLNDLFDIPGLGTFARALLSTDLKDTPGKAIATIMQIDLSSSSSPDESDEERQERSEKLDKDIEELIISLDLEYVGPSILSQTRIDEEGDAAFDEFQRSLLPLAFVIIVVVLLIIFRSPTDFIFSILALVFTLIWVTGFTALFGFLANSPLAQIVPILLIGLGVDYGIHLTMRYREEVVKNGDITKSTNLTVLSVGAALGLATITTMVGFLSNLSSRIIIIREFGMLVALGVLSAFFIYTLFVPAAKILLDRRRQKRGKPLMSKGNEKRARSDRDELSGISARFAGGMDLGARIALTRPVSWLSIIGVISVVLLYLATLLPTTFSFTEFLPEDAEVTQDLIFLTDNFEFSQEVSIVYVRGSNVALPAVLAAMGETQDNLVDNKNVLAQRDSPLSPLTLMQDLADPSDLDTGGRYDAQFASLWNDSSPDGSDIPQRNVTMLFDWIMENYPENTPQTLYQDESTGMYTVALIRVNTNSKSGLLGTELHEGLIDDAVPLERLKSDGTLDAVVVTGFAIILDVVLTGITESMISSIIITIVAASIVLTFVFLYSVRSKALGIITTIPVLLVLVWILGSMYILGISLNVVTILIAAMSVGLGITYAIHITHRFVEELESHGEIEKATHVTVMSTGVALFGAAITTMVGFGVLLLSSLVPFQNFGTTTALTILYSFLSSVFVLPSLLVLWARATSKGMPLHPLMTAHSGREGNNMDAPDGKGPTLKDETGSEREAAPTFKDDEGSETNGAKDGPAG